MAANDRTGVGAGSGSWQTPDEEYERYNYRHRFTYDPFASHENAKCDLYSTVDGTFRKCRKQGEHSHSRSSTQWLPCLGYVQVSDLDGLRYSWAGQVAFCNPPYTIRLVDRCIEKMVEERDNARLIGALVNAATETGWFQLLAEHSWVEYLRKRVQYVHPPFACGPKCKPGEAGHVFGVASRNSPGGGAFAILRAGEAYAWR